MIAPLLQSGDTVRVIAPARSLKLPWIGDELIEIATRRLETLGLTVTFGKYVNERDAFDSSSIGHRLEDLHDAFADPSVKLVLTVIGGYNSNQLLRHIDYDLIRENPKRFCGYSDITALSNAIFAKTGLVTYSGPHFFNFGQKRLFDYTRDAFIGCHFFGDPIVVRPSVQYVDGYWATNQDGIESLPNKGWMPLRHGTAEGTIVGGNLSTIALLFGTEYMPRPEGDIILFVEDDAEGKDVTFDRMLQSLLHQPWFGHVRAVVVGRCERASGITDETLATILDKRELRALPVIANVDFGHTTPMITYPIGGTCRVTVGEESSIGILTH